MSANFAKSRFLSLAEGMKVRGINNLLEFLDSLPSPIKGEAVFLTFYDFIIIAR